MEVLPPEEIDALQTQLIPRTEKEYSADLIERISTLGAGDRVAIATMSFNPEEGPFDSLAQELAGAAGRGVDVKLAVDSFAFTFDRKDRPTGPLVVGNNPYSSRSYFRSKLEAIHRIRVNGGSASIINTPRHTIHNPYSGHSHLKGAVINDTAYFGGCNLEWSELADIMVEHEDAKTANWLFSMLSQGVERKSIRAMLADRDVRYDIDDKTTVLMDAGVPRQSAILDKALSVIDEANDWLLMSCQYFPSGSTLKHLAQAYERGVDVHIIYNNMAVKHVGGSVLNLMKLKNRLWVPTELFAGELSEDHPFLHAKVLATEAEAMVGSHNYVGLGVMLGTSEVTIARRDPKFAHVMARFVLERVGWEDDPKFAFLRKGLALAA